MHVAHCRLFETHSLIPEMQLITLKLILQVLVYRSQACSWNCIWTSVDAYGTFGSHDYDAGSVLRHCALRDSCGSDISNIPKKVLFAHFPDRLAREDVKESHPAALVVHQDQLFGDWMCLEVSD